MHTVNGASDPILEVVHRKISLEKKIAVLEREIRVVENGYGRKIKWPRKISYTVYLTDPPYPFLVLPAERPSSVLLRWKSISALRIRSNRALFI